MYHILQITAIVTAQISPDKISLWDMIIKGGWLMIPIFILSFIGIYVIFERHFAIRKANRTSASFAHQIIEYVSSGNNSTAIQECQQADTPMARMFYKGILFSHIPSGDLRNTMENTASAEISSLEKGLSLLATIAGLAPMIGFLGTVVGMVQAFYDMSLAGNNINITLLSRGIYTAMITTVAGLIVGIIAYFGYNILVARINTVANNLENACSDFIDSLYNIKKNK